MSLRNAFRASGALLAILALFGCISAGCATGEKPGNSRFAWVKIQGNTPGQIRQMIVQVFRENGYETPAGASQELSFERKATGLSNLAYGNWGDENALYIRVKAEIIPDGEQTFLLQCRAYMVRDRATSIEEETRIHKRGTFQALLDEVARRLSPGQDRAAGVKEGKAP